MPAASASDIPVGPALPAATGSAKRSRGKRPDVYCEHCGRRMGVGRGGRRRTCSQACRTGKSRAGGALFDLETGEEVG